MSAKMEDADYELYTLEQVAQKLNLSKSSIERLICLKRRSNAPTLRTVKIGRNTRVTRQDLDQFIRALRVSAGIRGA